MLEHLDLLDTTLIVLTSDHGMELQDRTRQANPTRAIGAAGVAYRKVGSFVYFKQLDSELVTSDLQAGQRGSVTLRVYDRDTRWGAETVGAPAVVAQVIDGGTSAALATGADGEVTLAVEVDADATDVLVEFTSNEWTTYRVRVPVQ